MSPLRRLAEILARLDAVDEELRRRRQAMNYASSLNGLVELEPFPTPTTGPDLLLQLGYPRQWGEMFRPSQEGG